MVFSLLLFPMLSGCNTQPQWPDEPIPNACDAGAGPNGEVAFTVDRPDRKRRGVIWMPEGPGPHDVIVNLHEFRSEPRRQNHYSGWVALAKEKNAYLVGPDGKSSMWNAGECCGKARDQGIDDVGFLDALVAHIDETGCTTGNVLATGIGNGGMMAHRWACESDVVDGVISVGGALQTESCAAERAIPVLMYHGAKDGWMPLDGSGNHRTLAHAEAAWARRNAAPEVDKTLDVGPLDCRFRSGEADVGVCVIETMEDHWPGAADAPLSEVDHPLKDAARGGFEWIEARW
jgi:poly(3-hydroxybutyrate) depolymerase